MTEALSTICLKQTRDVSRKVSLRLLPFMFVLYIMSYLDRINVSFAGLQMNQELGFTDTVFGFGLGIFFVGYFIFGIPSNMMVAKIGASKWISGIMIVWGAISVAMALVKDEQTFYLMRFFLGVAEAGFFPGMILYLTYWFPKRERGLAIARFMTAIPVAGVLGGIVASQLLAMHGLYGLAGWKWLFIITGAPSILLGFMVCSYLTDRPESAKWLNDTEKRTLLDSLAADRSTEQHACTSVSSVFTNKKVWLFALIYFCLTVGMYGFQLWLPQIIHAFGGLSDSQTALLSAIPAVFQALGMVIIAWNSDRLGERRWHVGGCTALAAVALVVSSLVHDPVLSMCALSIAAFGIWGTVGPFWSLPTASLSPGAAAAGIALINSVGNLGGFAGPYIVGLIKSATNSFACALGAMALSLIMAGVLALVATRAGADSSAARDH